MDSDGVVLLPDPAWRRRWRDAAGVSQGLLELALGSLGRKAVIRGWERGERRRLDLAQGEHDDLVRRQRDLVRSHPTP